MAKYSFQDIKISRKKRNGLVEHNKESEHAKTKSFEDKEIKNISKDKKIHTKLQNTKDAHNMNAGSRIVVWGIAVVSVFFLVLLIFGLFSGATVKVLPKTKSSVVDGVFKAVKKRTSGSELAFQVMVVTTQNSKKVSSTKERRIEKKASGKIIIYNTYNSSSQRLIKNTRFETSKGKIYKIKESIIVPGIKVEQGKTVPGSIEAIVYADEPGESYNIKLTDFKIPGFKGGPRYKKFYARSQTEMTGGFSGLAKVPSEDDLKNANKELRNELNKKLISEANSQKPNGFILYKDAMFISVDEKVKEEITNDSVKLTLGAKLYGVIFNKTQFAKFIAEQSIASFDDSAVEIPELENLNFKIQNKESISPFDEDLRFSLSGNIKIIWSVNKDELKSKLLGTSKNKKKFESTMSEFPNIEKAEASIRPFWKRNFPNKKGKIKIEILPNNK